MKMKNFQLLFVIAWLWLGPVEASSANTKQRRRRRRRLDPLTASPVASHRRLQHRLHQLRTHSLSAQRNLQQKIFPGNPFSDVPHNGDDQTILSLPKTRSWSIRLSEPPIWICQQSEQNKSSSPTFSSLDSCQKKVKKEQDDFIFTLRQTFPLMLLKDQVQHIINAIFVELPFEDEIPLHWKGVQSIALEEDYLIAQVDSSVLQSIGATFANDYCLTGEGIRVGILDTGIDYTHSALGGPGTREAYLSAYGVNQQSAENKNRDDNFPTEKVIEGVDYLGEDNNRPSEDNDPIDGNGHGTFVASAILSVAPDVDLLVAKVCSTSGNEAGDVLCPGQALLRGIEYMLDPLQTGTLNEKADIINLSLVAAFNRAYYDVVAYALENVARIGVLCVTAFGNMQNFPYFVGASGATPNVLSVGATNSPVAFDVPFYMDSYSSRGPGFTNLIKPDISAPGTLSLAAAGTGDQYAVTAGTSFAAPLVTGAAALLKQHCPTCDSFAIKCILMNTADRNILYGAESGEERMAPVTRMGSGLLRIDKALNATAWAYSLEGRQPSLSFGVVDAHIDFIYTKTIRIHTIDTRGRSLRLNYELRNPSKANVLSLTFVPSVIEIPEGCSTFVDVQVQAYIFASLAPINTMSTSGFQMYDPEPLDRHEFDGHIILSSLIDQEIALPFHFIIRKAAAPELTIGSALPFQYGPIKQNFTIVNPAYGPAQIDAYELIVSDIDDEEAPYGIARVESDIRSIGYRTVPVGDADCNFTVEFSFHTWERFAHVGQHSLIAEIYPDGPNGELVSLEMLPFPFISETYITYEDNSTACTGFSTDHASNTANTILRACSNDLRLEGKNTFTAQFRSLAHPLPISTSYISPQVELTFPDARLKAHSYNIPPFSELKEFLVTGEISPDAFGLQLVTNAFRNTNATGAAVRTAETLYLTKQGITLEEEQTLDFPVWPGLFNQSGPPCDLRLPGQAQCQGQGTISDIGRGMAPNITTTITTASPNCPPVEVPRLIVPTPAPTNQASANPTIETEAPSARPTRGPSSSPVPTLRPSTLISAAPRGLLRPVFVAGQLFTLLGYLL